MMSDSKIIDQIQSEAATLVIGAQASALPGNAYAAPPLPLGVPVPEHSENKPLFGSREEEDPAPDGQMPAEPVQKEAPAMGAHSEEGLRPTEKRHLTNKEVTDHTASLWKYLPVPSEEPEPAPEYLQSDVCLPGGHVIAARVRGKKHKHEGTNCDDWYEIANVDDVTFIAVSDGAGSKKFSRIGARESCRASVGYLATAYGKLLAENPTIRELLGQELSSEACMEACGKIASIVQKSVVQAAEAVEAAFYARAADPAYARLLKRNLDIRDLSGTLLIAAIVPLVKKTKEHLIVTCQVGDGMIASINSKGAFQTSVKLLGVPDSGEFSGETEFLTAPQMKTMEALQKRTKLSRGVTDTVMLMSDGVADDYFPNETQMRRLYFDLLINGVIDMEDRPSDLSKLSPKEMSLFKRIPDPVLYPWVNDKSVMVPIQYTNRICDAMGISLEDLWEDRAILGLASLEVKEEVPSSDAGERLRVWLDNYYERGSFDDRTLVVVQL